MPKPQKPLHLTASMKVVRAHQRRRHVSIEDTRRAVQEAALRIAQGVAGPETHELAAKLEKMTGCSIAELAVHAEDWPEV
jgi:hypothetical protein